MSPSTSFFSRVVITLRLTLVPASLLITAPLLVAVEGCSPATNRYRHVEESLRAGDTKRADLILAQAEQEYGAKSRVLYKMDRGMTLHLAGRYQESNAMLEQADEEMEQLYTRRVRTETKAFLLNDTELPYEGEPYEQVMLNVLKSINYAVLGNWDGALVEARRIDHRLNLLSDKVAEKEGYRDDAFARYLTGILYEVAGDVNNAFIAYRKAYEAYRAQASWLRTPLPPMLREDLLRSTDALHLSEEHQEYRRAFAEVSWRTLSETQRLAHVVVISYNGTAPQKEDQFIDLPISLDALNLVLLTKRFGGPNTPENRVTESILYGLNGNVVRVAVPRLVPQKTQAATGEVRLTGKSAAFSARTELVQNLTALAEKNLADRFSLIAVKAVARAAVKQTLATGFGRGAQSAAGKDIGPLVGVLAGAVARSFAIATEEADKRSWRTLPDEVQLARLWVPPGEYELRIRSLDRGGSPMGRESVQAVTVQAGESRFYTVRVLP